MVAWDGGPGAVSGAASQRDVDGEQNKRSSTFGGCCTLEDLFLCVFIVFASIQCGGGVSISGRDGSGRE